MTDSGLTVLLLVGVLCGCVGLAVGLWFGCGVLRRISTKQDGGGEVGAFVDAASSARLTGDLTAVLDASAVGVVLSSPDGGIVYRNAMARSLGGTHAGLLLDERLELLLETARAGRSSEQLIEFYGPPRVAFNVRAIGDHRGGAFAFIDDISERRRVDSVRTDFVANISHELKTPVGALAVLAETLADERDPEIVVRIADRMLDEAHRAARTIDDLLELSEIELGGEFGDDAVAAADIVRSALERVVPIAEPRRITVVARPGPSVMIRGDRRQLFSAVGNLVENAVKYSDEGGSVEVSTTLVDGWIEFMVSDNGVGIPHRDLDRIFERFYRVDKARSRGTGGSGLGLAIVRHVATNHGGEVTVTSQEGEGSTFWLRLPLDHQPAATNPAPSTSGSSTIAPVLPGVSSSGAGPGDALSGALQ